MAVDNGDLQKFYRSKYASLTNIRAPKIAVWTDIRNFLNPYTARFQGEQVNQLTRQDQNIINGSPRFAIRTLAAGMQSGVTSPMRPWFRLGFADPDLTEWGPVKMWLYLVERQMRDVFAKSNIYDRLKSNYGTLGTYGTSGFGLDEDDEDIIRGHDWPIGSFLIATSAAGRVTHGMREIMFTAEQFVEKFAANVGMKNLPSFIQNAYDKGNYDALYPVVHVIEPNRNYRIGSQVSKLKKFSSVYWDPATQAASSILSYKGYDEMPIMAPRWDVLGEDVWGTGCGDLAIGDSKQGQLMEKRKLQGIDKNVNPTMVGDASLRNQRTTNMPGETTYVSGLITGNQGYRPAYQVNPYITEIREEVAAIMQRIDEAFYKNLFLMVSEIADQPNITATQINTMREEKLLMLGPVLERLQDELLDPLISRTFNLMYRRGLIPPPPQEIQGMTLRVEYISVLAQAQKAMGIGNIERFFGFVGQIAQVQAAGGQAPTAFDKLDFDAMIDEYADGVAVPPTIVRPNDAANQIRGDRDQSMQQQQQMAMAAQGVQAAKTLSETDTSGDNALTRMMNQGGMNAQ